MRSGCLVLLVIPLFFLLSCKRSKKSQDKSETGIQQKSILILDKYCLEKRKTTSIIQSCGAGCVISYSEKDISVVDSFVKVNYKRSIHIYEEGREKSEGALFIECLDKESVVVFFEGQEDENILDIDVTSINTSFQMYADQICKCIK